MSVAKNITEFKKQIPNNVTLIAVSKTHGVDKILEAYHSGHKIFGENKVQELREKQPLLPNDIEWHLIGHLQTNKVKYIASFVKLIHSVDSFKLLEEINKQAEKHNRTIDCLLQIHIAQEETKFGLSFNEADALLSNKIIEQFKNVKIVGLMGMATNTTNEEQIRQEFKSLKQYFEKLKKQNSSINILSMGMSSDYKMAIAECSTMIRVGSLLFGERNYSNQ